MLIFYISNRFPFRHKENDFFQQKIPETYILSENCETADKIAEPFGNDRDRMFLTEEALSYTERAG